jgi:S-formylglutathione hydrolase
MDSLARSLSAIAIALGLATTPVSGQAGRVVHDSIRSSALAGNLLGDSPTREVLVYLPPGYDRSPLRRYPVLYLLHGFLAHPNLWLGEGYLRQFNLAQTMDSLVGAGTVREFLIVMPDGSTRLGGSHYTSSATNGDWEKFLARELVDHVDRTYRTIRRATSRGLAGHSMGGYGTFRLLLLHPGIWGAGYALSTGTRVDSADAFGAADSALAITTLEQLHHANIRVQAMFARAAARSSDPGRPPFYGDLPVRRVGRHVEIDRKVFALWERQSVLALVSAHSAALRSLKALAFDVGDSDQFGFAPQGHALDSLLTSLALPHTFDEYHGRHSDKVPERMTAHVLPFFSRVLEFEDTASH